MRNHRLPVTGLGPPPLVRVAPICVADPFDQDLPIARIVCFRPIDGLCLGSLDDAGAVGIRLPHGVVALRSALDELLLSVHGIPPNLNPDVGRCTGTVKSDGGRRFG